MSNIQVIAIACAIVCTTPASSTERCTARSTAHSVPLVELYTSEGCSSCPPADRWLSRSLASTPANFLAFHVDYWDSLGWPDRFASPIYSQRQRARISAAGGDTVYTPQVMLGADVGANWSVASAWKSELERAEGQLATASISLRVDAGGGGFEAVLDAQALQSTGKPARDSKAQVWLAQYDDAQTSDVRAGENRGATLRHDRVVTGLFGPWSLARGTWPQHVALTVPASAWGLTAFVQTGDGAVLQSLALPASDCGSDKP